MGRIILNFHGVGPVLRDMDDAERECWLPQDQFEAVLDLVRGQSHVQLTFDDGNVSDVDIALPALLRRRLSATFFLCSSRLDRLTFLSRSQVCELQGQGMSIGSHGVVHRSWRGLTAEQLDEELLSSRHALEELCGVPVDMAACPFGEYDRRVLLGLRAANYRRVFTSDDGTVSNREWLLARNTVTRSMPLGRVQILIERGTSLREQWLINARRLYKRFR